MSAKLGSTLLKKREPTYAVPFGKQLNHAKVMVRMKVRYEYTPNRVQFAVEPVMSEKAHHLTQRAFTCIQQDRAIIGYLD